MAITGDQSDSVKKTEAELTQNQLDEMRKLYFENVEIRTESNPTYPPEGLVLTRYMAPEYLEARLGESDPQFSQKPRANDTVFYPIGLRTKYVFDFYMSRAWYLEIDLVFEGPEAEVLREANSMVGSMSNLPEVWLEIRDEHGAPLRFPPPLRERTDMSASIHYTQAGFYSEELGEGKIRLLQPYGVALAEKPEPGIYTVRFLSPGSNIELLRRQGFGSLPVTLVDDSWHTFELDYASLERAPRKNTEEE